VSKEDAKIVEIVRHTLIRYQASGAFQAVGFFIDQMRATPETSARLEIGHCTKVSEAANMGSTEFHKALLQLPRTSV